jgi:hypothetical protein
MSAVAITDPSRRLGAALEPVIGSVYFAPECHQRYEALGFAPSRGDMNGVALPDGPAYFTSRGSLMGQVPGELVAAAFGVFSPEAVVPSVAFGWTKTDAETIREARFDGAVAQLRRVLPNESDNFAAVGEVLAQAVAVAKLAGRPLFAGAIAQPKRNDPLEELFRLGDALREYRGDSHTAAWTAAGLDAVEIGLLTELYWGVPLHSYVRTRAWTDAQVTDAIGRLETRGLVADRAFTPHGRAFREQIEAATDLQMAPLVAAMGAAFEPTIALLEPWGATVRGAKGYPTSGPHELAEQARNAASA